MTKTNLRQHLREVHEQCQNILDAVGTMSFEDYEKNLIVRSAVERFLINLGIIATQIRQEYPEQFDELEALRLAIGLRNRLAHGYEDVIDDAKIWQVIQKSVPKLMEEVRSES